MKDKEKKLMMKIAKEVDGIKNRPWFKRLDQEEQSIALKRMTAPPETQQEYNVRTAAPQATQSEPIWVITTTFKAANLDKINDNKMIQDELKEHITRICREHGISRMVIHFEEQQPSNPGGGRPVEVAPQPLG